MRAAAVGAGLGDDPLRPHRDRGLGVRRKRHVAPVATPEVDAPESPRSAVLATELRHLGAGRQQRRRAGVAKLVEIDLVAAGPCPAASGTPSRSASSSTPQALIQTDPSPT